MKNDNDARKSQYPNLETLLSTPELCDFLGISRDTLYEWREINTAPPAIKLPNGHLRFPLSALLNWLDGRREQVA